MNKLVEIRITDAGESFDRVKKTLQQAANRKSEAEALSASLRKLAFGDQSLTSFDALIRRCKGILADFNVTAELQESNALALADQVKEAERSLQSLKNQLNELQETAAKLAERRSNGDQVDRHVSNTIEVLDRKRRFLNIPRPIAANQAPDVLGRIEAMKPLWGEHIENVAGVILRDDVFDKGLSKKSLSILADNLIELCQLSPPFARADTLNILGHDHASLTELKYTVYFRFPTWSVWGLPLTGHEFWHATSSKLRDDTAYWESFAAIPQADSLWKEPLVQDCLADTFATFVIGPAYAFACVLLVLDVSAKQDRVRAQTVFDTLRYLAQVKEGDDESNQLWYASASDLQNCWSEASGPNAQIRPEIACPLAARKSSCPLVDTELIDRMRIALLELMRETGELRYDINSWSVAADDLVRLLEFPEEEMNKQLRTFSHFNKIDLRHILHAGWLSRWKLKNEGQQLTTLATRVEETCSEVVRRRRVAPTPKHDRNGPI